MGVDNAAKLMIKSGVCDEDLTEFDEEKANLLGAYKAITGVFKKKEVKKFFTNSDTEVKALFATIKDAEKSIAESEQIPANNIAPLAGLRNLGASAVNFFQRFANR
jgi:hypothetical protein